MARGRKKKQQQLAEGGAEGEAVVAAAPRKSNLLPAIVIAVGLIAGGKLMGGEGSAASPAPVAVSTTVAAGPVVKLDPITLNMADGRFVRVGLGLQLAPGEQAPSEDEPDTSDPAGHYAKALDIVIQVLGGRHYGQLVDPAGRAQAKQEVVAQLEAAYHGEIEDLYFTEFVLQ